jgi:hypothetical protein
MRLETTRPNFGGLRWWFLCPITGRRVGVLYLPGKGGTVFASRQASGLAYRSQRASPEDRAVERSLTKGADEARRCGPEHVGHAVLPAAEMDAVPDASTAGGCSPRVPRHADALHCTALADGRVSNRFSPVAEVLSAKHSI